MQPRLVLELVILLPPAFSRLELEAWLTAFHFLYYKLVSYYMTGNVCLSVYRFRLLLLFFYVQFQVETSPQLLSTLAFSICLFYCTCMYAYHMHAWVCKCQKRAPDSLELRLWATVSYHMDSGTESGFSVKAVTAEPSLSPSSCFYCDRASH